MYKLICLLFAILTFNHCVKEVEPNQNYSVTIITETQNIFSNSPPFKANIDTSTFDIFITDDQFDLGKCKGTFKQSSKKIEFSSDECGCWCDCNPLVDCGGHRILGEYDYQKTNTGFTLTFQNDFKTTLQNITMEQKFKKTVILTMK